MASKRNRGSRQCTYCTDFVDNAISEHVLGKKMFAEADRADLPQVPACPKCNNEKSKLEERLSYYWALAQFSDRKEHTERKLKQNHPEVRRIKETAHDVLTPEGFVEFAIGDATSHQLVEQWIDFIVRGLHRFHFEQVVPSTHECTFVSVTELPDEFMDLLSPLKIQRFGPFLYKVIPIQPPEIGSIWLFDLLGYSFADNGNQISGAHLAFLQSAESFNRTLRGGLSK